MPTSEAGGRRARHRLLRLCVALLLLGCGEAPAAPASAEASGIAQALAAGGRHSFASLSHACAVVDQKLQCWGASERGQTGDGALARRRPLPVRVPGLEGVQAVAAGGSHTCVSAGGRVHCFGGNDHAQAGGERPFVRLAPAVVEGLPDGVTALAAGLEHSCAIAQGRVYCWGRNEQGEAGAAPPTACREPFRVRRCSVPPVEVPGIEHARALALGDRHSCASTGEVVACWGANQAGELGDGGRASRFRAAPVRGLPGPVSGLAAGADHSCAIAGGALYCWGAGRDAPQRVAGLPTPIAFVAAGGAHTCAASEAQAWCWQRGAAPVLVAGLRGPLGGLAVSPDHACAIRDAAVWCWGENDAGQLGRGVGACVDATCAEVAPPEPVADWDRGVWRDANGDGRITLVCLGDSNTAAMPGADAPWCDLLPQLLADAGAPLRVRNRGIGGATAAPSLVDAALVVEHAVESDAPDLALLAYGSNDVLAGTPTEEIVAALRRHESALLAAGVLPLVALVPPVRSDDAQAQQGVRALNEALRDSFPVERRVDFVSGVSDADLLDRVHLDGATQQRLARRAAEAVLRLRPEPAP